MIIVAFDSDCLMCNGFVFWLLKHDKQERLTFTGLNSAYFETLCTERNLTIQQDSLIFISGSKIAVESTAVIETLRQLKGLQYISPLAYALPRSLRDVCYRFIARRRKKTSSFSTCPIIPPQWRHRFK